MRLVSFLLLLLTVCPPVRAQVISYVDARTRSYESLPSEMYGGFGYVSVLDVARILDAQLVEQTSSSSLRLEFESGSIVLFEGSAFLKVGGNLDKLEARVKTVGGRPMVPLGVFGKLSSRFPGIWTWDAKKLALARADGKTEVRSLILKEEGRRARVLVVLSEPVDVDVVSRSVQNFSFLLKNVFFHPAKISKPEPVQLVTDVELVPSGRGVLVTAALGDSVVGYRREVSAADTVSFVFTGDTLAYAQESFVSLERPEVVEHEPAKVVIDAGHGGSDVGCAGIFGDPEKDIALEIALQTKASLLDAGITDVMLTRDGDVALTTRDRVGAANTWGGTIFVSIHTDCWRSQNVEGARIYYARSNGRVARSPGSGEGEPGPASPGPAGGLEVWTSDSPVTEVSNGKLARALQRAFVESGVSVSVLSTEDVLPLAGLKMPSVTVSVGFLSNRKEGSLLSQTFYQRLLGRAIATGIQKYAAGTEARPH